MNMNDFELTIIPTGLLGSNCYIMRVDDAGVIIDAGADAGEIIEEVRKSGLGLSIEYLILTHGHIDHIISAAELKRILGCRICIHKDDASLLTDPIFNGSELFGIPLPPANADILLSDGSILDLAGTQLEVIHTPGHTSGGICIKTRIKAHDKLPTGDKLFTGDMPFTGNMLFTGDTLFRGSVGRTDLGLGNHTLLIRSIKDKLLNLKPETVIYPGHGPSSTIGEEKAGNPFIL